MNMKTLALVPVVAVTAACGGSSLNENISFGNGTPTPTPSAALAVGSAAENPDGTFVVTQGASLTNLPAPNVTVNGQQAWRIGFNGGTFNADSFSGTDVLAIGGVSDAGTPFAGLTGTRTIAPTGDATFTGRFALAQTNGTSVNSPLTLAYDMSDGTLTNVGGDLGVDASALGNDLSGTVTFNNESADLAGGFFGTNEVAGAFNSTSFGGILFGTSE